METTAPHQEEEESDPGVTVNAEEITVMAQILNLLVNAGYQYDPLYLSIGHPANFSSCAQIQFKHLEDSGTFEIMLHNFHWSRVS